MKNYKNKGLTLAELAFVLFIMAVMLILFLPKFGESVDKTRVTGVKSDFKVFMIAAEGVLREGNGLSQRNSGTSSLGLSSLNVNLDKSYQVSTSQSETYKLDPWKNHYKVSLRSATNSGTAPVLGDAKITFQSAGKDGIYDNSDDILIYSYLYKGEISSCTAGYGSGELVSSIPLVGDLCGANAVL